MKRLILLASGMLAMLQVSAQELPGSIFIITNIGADIQRDEYGSSSKTLQLSPSVNFLLNNRWSLGLFADHGRNTLKTDKVSSPGSGYYTTFQKIESKYRSLTFGPQVRYYQPIVSKLFLLSEVQAGFKLEKQKVHQNYASYYNNGNESPVANGESNSEASATSMQLNVSPGLIYFIKPKFGIELKTNIITYNHGLKNSISPQDDAASRNFKIDLSLASTNFGFSYYF